MTPEIAFLPAALIAVIGAALDVRSRRIPNRLVMALAIAAAGATLVSFGWAALGSAALHALIALLVGMALFALRAIGGGDAKFYSAAAFGVPLSGALGMLAFTAISGLVAVVAMLIWYRGFKMSAGQERRSWTLPYGLPICCGFLIQAYSLTGFF